MTSKSNWFGNVTAMLESINGDGILNRYITPNFIEITPLALTMYSKNVFRAQQTRDYYLNLV